MACPSAPAVPTQIDNNAALTSLSVPVLPSVGRYFYVRHTHPPASRICCLPSVRSIRPPSGARVDVSPPMPLMACPSAPAVPHQIHTNEALISLSVPELASVGGYFEVRHTHPPTSRICGLPCVRSIRPPTRARLCVPPHAFDGAPICAGGPPTDLYQLRRHQLERAGARVRRRILPGAPHPTPCFAHLRPAVCAFDPAPHARAAMCPPPCL
eukprot:scaffold14113_cov50-Isochrysis_galbana.AAC.2